MNPSLQLALSRLVAWSMLIMISHAIVSFILWILFLFAWAAFLSRVAPDSLAIGIIAVLALPVITDYPFARVAMRSRPIARLMLSIEKEIQNEK